VLKNKSFTLTELLIVVVIIGVLAALALPGFGVTKERVLDREAKATLSLLQAAEKIYRMEEGGYYSSTDIGNINTNLRLNIPASGLSWGYGVDNSQATAARLPSSSRVWTLAYTDDVDADHPSCTGTGCPP